MPETKKRKNAWLYDPGEFAKLLWQSMQEQAQRTAQWYGARPLGAVGGEAPSSFPSWLTPRAQAFMPGAPTARTQQVLQTGRGLLGAPTPAKQEPRMVIEQEGGYDVLVQYDEKGNRTVLEVIGPSRAGAESRWQYEQILGIQERAEEKRRWELGITENAKQRAWEQSQQRLTGFLNYGGESEALRAQASTNWNEWRNRIAAATPEWDFMKKWEVGQMEDPFAPIKRNPIEENINTQRQIDRLKDKSKELETEWLGILKSGQYGDESLESRMAWDRASAILESKRTIDTSVPYLELQVKQRQSSPEYKEALLRATPQRDAMGNWSVGGGDEIVKPKGPEAPAWLSKYVPEYPVGTEITKPYKVAPASLQALSQAAPSELLGLKSYLTYAGQKPEDWLAETMLRQTKTPAIAGGWSPASQRA